jgi:hypothetical protein
MPNPIPPTSSLPTIPASKPASEPATVGNGAPTAPSGSQPASDAGSAAGKVKEPEQAKETPQEGRLLAQIRAREKRFVEEQQRARQEHDRERWLLQQEREAFGREREAAASQVRQREEQERQAIGQKDPLRWFQEEQAAKLAAYDKTIADLKGELESLKHERVSERQQAAIDRELGQLTTQAKASEERGHAAKLADRAPGKFRDRAMAIARAELSQGVRLTNDEILDKLEEELAEEASIWTDSGKQRDSAPTQATNGHTPSPATAPKTQAPTLTNERAGERSVELSPADFARLSVEERRRILLERLAEERAKRKAAAAQ